MKQTRNEPLSERPTLAELLSGPRERSINYIVRELQQLMGTREHLSRDLARAGARRELIAKHIACVDEKIAELRGHLPALGIEASIAIPRREHAPKFQRGKLTTRPEDFATVTASRPVRG